MSSIFSPPKPKAPPKPPEKSDVEVAQAAAEERRRAASRRGRGSTVLGGSVGTENTQAKRLLGQ